jgi:PST family polysaccharide transporter/lipopolysaccharide exporter
MLAASATRVIVSYLMVSYRPHLRFDRAKAQELFSFGKWVLASGVILYLLLNLDYMVVGVVLGVTALGFYRMAYNLSQLVVTELTTVTSQVAFPAYSRIQSDPARLSSAYLKVLSAVAVGAFPVAVGTALLAEDITLVLLGDQWTPMITALQILAFAGLSRALAGTAGPLFQAVGRPDVLAKVSFVRLVLLAIIIYPLTVNLGIEGSALAILLTSLAVHGGSLYLATRFSEAPLRSMAGAIAFPAAHAAIMALAVFGVRALLPAQIGLLGLILLVAVGVATYVLATLASHTVLGYEAQGLAMLLRRAKQSDAESAGS